MTESSHRSILNVGTSGGQVPIWNATTQTYEPGTVTVPTAADPSGLEVR